MKTVTQINSVLSTYLPASGGVSPSTMIGMLNQILPRFYEMLDHPAMLAEWETDISSAYFFLPPDYCAINSATINGEPVQIRSLTYETQYPGTGPLAGGVGSAYGFIDKGLGPLMSEISTEGADEFLFTSTSSFSPGDTVTVTFNDAVDGRIEVTIPLHAISTSISSASASGDGNTTLVVSSTTGFVANMGVTITSGGTGYNDTWRVMSVTDATHMVIAKTFSATTTGTVANAKALYPPYLISSVEKVEYASLPAKVMMKDADDIIYAILPPGDGISQYRRYNCPQVPEDTEDEFVAICVVKRAFVPLTSTSDPVYIDNIGALKAAIFAVIYEDRGELEAAQIEWDKAKALLEKETWNVRGGVQETQSVNPWGAGVAGINGRY